MPELRSHTLERMASRFALAWIVATLWCGSTARAEEGEGKHLPPSPPSGSNAQAAAPASNSTEAQSAQKITPNSPPTEALSPLVKDVVKLADANVSPTVIKTFVECSTSAGPLTDADVIALKKHNVPDEIVTVLLKQGAKTRALDAQRKSEAVARVLAARQARSGGLDPESYDYFRYYYLQPRATASVYQRLSPYYAPWGYYPYGPSPAFGFPHYYGRGIPRY